MISRSNGRSTHCHTNEGTAPAPTCIVHSGARGAPDVRGCPPSQAQSSAASCSTPATNSAAGATAIAAGEWVLHPTAMP